MFFLCTAHTLPPPSVHGRVTTYTHTRRQRSLRLNHVLSVEWCTIQSMRLSSADSVLLPRQTPHWLTAAKLVPCHHRYRPTDRQTPL